jgi:hypothetical protein
MSDMDVNDKYSCAELIQSWGLYRDQGKWPQLIATFVPDGEIAVSWFSGSFREFVERCRKAFEAGQRSKHQIFPSTVRVAGDRALAETNVVILVRQKIEGVLADMTSYARFLDRLERGSGRWAIRERAAIRSSRRRRSTSSSQRPTSRPIPSPTAIWPRASSPPVERSRRWCITTGRNIRRSSTRATRHGWPGNSGSGHWRLRNPHERSQTGSLLPRAGPRIAQAAPKLPLGSSLDRGRAQAPCRGSLPQRP